MTEFPIERRNLLRATGAGVLGTAASAQASAGESTPGGGLIRSFETGNFVLSSPTLVNRTVYVGSGDGN